VRAENLPLLNSPSVPAVHPDGSHAVVSLTHPDLDADAYLGQLWRVPFDGTPSVRITRGFRDASPKFSPDGALLGFLRAEPGGAPQLAVMPAAGGEPMVVTDAQLGVCDFAFSEDGSRLAYTARVAETGRYGTIDGVGAATEDPRLITGVQFQYNGAGYLADKRGHLFVLDTPDPHAAPPVRPVGRAAVGAPAFRAVPEARQLSQGDYDHYWPVWDGDGVIVCASRHPGRDTDLRVDLYRFPLDGAGATRLTDSAAGDSVIGQPVVAGDHVFFVGGHTGESGRDFFGENPGVFAVARSGGPVCRLTDAETVHAAQLAADGDAVLGVDLVRGRGVAFRVTASGAMTRWDLPGSVLSLGAGGGVRVGVRADACTLGDLVILPADTSLEPAEAPAPLTDFSAALRAAAPAFVPRELTATAPDGYPVHGWVVRPDGDGPHPVVLMIHGGPFAAFGPAFFDEAQVYAEAGYAVVMCNPRGSASYGQAHAAAIRGALGDLDAADVLAFLDHALSTVPSLDAGRVGVMGGSYGGFLTAWLIAHESRFAAAIVERGYLDPRSFIGPSDIGWYFATGVHGSRENMDAQSPLLLVDRVRTPTLVIHSERDLRCPLATAQRYYTELKLNGVEAELLVFPGEDHELSRSGTPQHRRARFEHILRWWGKHLPT
jgi:dipeptidyl aminopeptidase/acylaminoacyl peptidase